MSASEKNKKMNFSTTSSLCNWSLKQSIMLFILWVVLPAISNAQPRYGVDSLVKREVASRNDYQRKLEFATANVVELADVAGQAESGTSDPKSLKELSKFEYLQDSMARFPLVLDAPTAWKIVELDPFRARRMFFYANDVVLDYNIYSYPNNVNAKIIAILNQELGNDYAKAHLPKVVVTGQEGADRFRYEQQVLTFLRSLGSNGNVGRVLEELNNNPQLGQTMYDAQITKGLTISQSDGQFKRTPAGSASPVPSKAVGTQAKPTPKPAPKNKVGPKQVK